jgi:hypothetical protein
MPDSASILVPIRYSRGLPKRRGSRPLMKLAAIIPAMFSPNSQP